MILAVPEYTSAPANPDQWDRYYNLTDDKLYIQTLAMSDPSYPVWVEIAEGAAVRESMRQQITLTRSRYSAKDYQTFLDEIVAYIAERWGDDFNDFMSSDPAMMIAEYISAAFDQLSWYLDREADEWYMELARVLSNVARLARYLGYKPQPSVSASVDLLITLTSGPYAFDVTLTEGHQFEGPNGLIFELASDQTISAGDTEKTVGAFQGKTYTETFISDGTANQQFNLSLVPDDEYLAEFKTQVEVGIDPWSEEDFLPYSADEVFEVVYLTSPPVLRFGNGVIGKIPPEGDEIRVSYVATKGNLAGQATAGTVTTSNTTVVENFEEIPITVTNPAAASGGAPPEDIDSIKTEAPRYFITADRLVTKNDYNTLAGQFSSVSGAVAKANATIIRGVGQDLELQGLMDALTSDREDLDDYLTSIKTAQTAIKALTGDSSTSDTIRHQTTQGKTATTAVKAKTDDIDTNVTTVKGNITDAEGHIELAQTQLDFLPFQEMIGQGDGTSAVFTKTLAKVPIKEGSAVILVSDKTPTKSATDGDCDTTPGRLNSATIGFVSADVGKLVRIGGEYRQIQKYVDSANVEYSGPRIYGTSLIVEVYPPAVIGYTDDTGLISGSGIASGSVNQSSGALTVTFSVAPEGISGKYGVPIMCTYQYKGESLQAVLDDALTETGTASTNVDTFTTLGDNIDTEADNVDGYLDQIDTDCDDIDTQADNASGYADDAGGIPDQIQNDVDELSDYLDEMFSGDCKANVVRVSCLVLDANGFYTAPSLALKGDLKTYLDARKIRTVQNSVVSGDFYLVKVKLRIEVKLEDLFVFQSVEDTILADIDTMFKGRDYAQPLLRSEYYGVVDAVDGVDYSNITVEDTAYQNSANTATPPSVDSDGNVFVSEEEVITKWDVTVVQI